MKEPMPSGTSGKVFAARKLIVIGGGPAGMMAAGVAAEAGLQVKLLEKNNRLGKKLNITGKGRCNLTNDKDPAELIEHITCNPSFMYSSIYGFDSRELMSFFQRLGVELVTERGGRVFPQGNASDIVNALKNFLKLSNVEVILSADVKSVSEKNGRVTGVTVGSSFYPADAVVIATGGLSYPATGSTGDGYGFARSLGHTVTKTYPSLVPLKTKEKWTAELMGLSLKNIAITVSIGGRKVYEDFGEMLFTHFGVSGPVILSASAVLKDMYDKQPVLSIDLKPALDQQDLDKRILRDFEKNRNKDLINALDELLPLKLIPIIIKMSGIGERKKVRDITKAERQSLAEAVKNLRLTVIGNTGYAEAVITSGGVSTGEINPSTMESKIISGLYFAGEVIDVDAPTGGYNLQIAFSTGYLAGKSVQA